MITETAKAKINLTLQIRGRRPDGYHELVSLVAFVEVGDTISLEPDAPFSVETDGPFAGAIEGENLIERACRLVREAAPAVRIGRIQLTKRLPVAAGLGGGSADAAAVLRVLARSEPTVARLDLHAIAAMLGADVSACLAQRPVVMWGVGEKLVEIEDLPPFWLVLANPGVPLATAIVFRALGAPPLAGPVERPQLMGPFGSLEALVGEMRERANDLQPVAMRLCPPIASVLKALQETEGCLSVAQSGSGPTCFGVYARAEHALAAAERIAAGRSGWWVAATAVGPCSPAGLNSASREFP